MLSQLQGRVTSFYGAELQRYTSFKAHPSGDGPVRQLLFCDKGVIALGSRSVHMASRKGPTLWHIVYGFYTAHGMD
jgi:PAB-dependent poly(A)-specific ribonuclease subunit 2